VSNVGKVEGGRVVKILPRKPNVHVGKPRRVVASAMLSKYGSGGSFGLGGGGIFGGATNTLLGSGGNFYSPELSTDFLELAQSLDELRQYFRFFYDNDPFVHQAVDVHTEIPLSKIRFGMPKAKNRELAKRSKRFCEKWARRVDLFQRLIEIVHEYHKIGEVFIWAEDESPDEPEDLREEVIRKIDGDGEPTEERVERKDADERATKWVQKHYKGWTKIRILPPEQVHIEAFPFTDEVLIQLVIDSKTKKIVQSYDTGADPDAKRIVESMPEEIVEAARNGSKVTLNTDPEAGSFVCYLARKRSQYEARGKSMLQCVLRILVYRDKLRQAQTSIASRNMTPTRIVTSEGADQTDVDMLREQIDMSLIDPDYTIVSNFPIEWQEMPSDNRLLDLSNEYDLTDRQMYAGMGVTESLLSGESSYAGDRLNIEIVNQRYLLLREILQNFVEDFLLKPMCARMGFIEEDEDGDEIVIHPRLTFTRMGLRDNDSIFDQLFNLYQKGSLDIWTIFDQLNIDGEEVQERLQKDFMTFNDPNFNELIRGLYSRMGDDLAENSDAVVQAAKLLGLRYEKPEEEGGSRW
jgi:hypothetical protein